MFRPDELYDAHGKQALLLAGRLRVAHESLKRLSIVTSIQQRDDHGVEVHAVVRWHDADGERTSSGTARADERYDIKLKDSLVEVAESRAISRALRFAGIGVEYVGSEEIDRKPLTPAGNVDQGNGRQLGAPPNKAAVVAVVAADNRAAEISEKRPALRVVMMYNRQQTAELLGSLVDGDQEKFRKVVSWLIPGVESLAGLTNEQADLVKLGLALRIHLGSFEKVSPWVASKTQGTFKSLSGLVSEATQLWSVLLTEAEGTAGPKATPF